MSSAFESEVSIARRRVRWADINVDDFLKELALESRDVKLEVDYRPSVAANPFAYRATPVEELGRVSDPVGPDNERHLLLINGRGSTAPVASSTAA